MFSQVKDNDIIPRISPFAAWILILYLVIFPTGDTGVIGLVKMFQGHNPMASSFISPLLFSKPRESV